MKQATKKGHKYITVVYDMDKNKVIWVHENHELEVFEKFCSQLTEEEKSKIEIVAGDGAKWIDTCTKKHFPNAIRCVDFFHVVQWANKALDEVRADTVKKANREYTKMKNRYIKAEAEATEEAAKAEEKYNAAVLELLAMPRRGRRSKKYKELQSFVLEYVTMDFSEIDEPQKKKAGRPKKEQFTPEHEASLSELKKKIDDVKASRYALGHKPSKCTESQNEKLRIIENSYPDSYQAYQIKESLRIILHTKDYELAEHELDNWIQSTKKCGLSPMEEPAKKIDRHRNNILNAIKYQANSAKSESTNTTIKYLIKLSRGFRNLENMFSLIYLKCSDIIIPLSNRIQPTNEYRRYQREQVVKRKHARESV